MSALTFVLKQPLKQRVDMSPLVCQRLTELTLAQIGALPLQQGKQQIPVEALFEVSGTDTAQIVIKNSSDKLDFIGKELHGGSITVEGDAGAYCGMGMKAGSITVLGNVGLFAACEMKKGQLTVHGNAGDFLGGALPGNKMGMKGGVVLIKGNVGERAGDHLRRGVILIEGNAGDYCGSRMTAGTIAVMGKVGNHLGYAMRRGTLLLWQPAKIPAMFNDCGTHTLAFLPLLFASFKGLDSKFADKASAFNRVQRYGGDMAEMGRGEILLKSVV